MSFNPQFVITNPNQLYGRDIILNQLLAHVKRNNNVQLIGMRRYGKTSLLKCLEYLINEQLQESIIPIYFDFKEVGSIVRGTSNVYRYIIARIIEKLVSDKILKSSIELKKVELKPLENWEDTYICLESTPDVKIQGLFRELLVWFSEYLNKTFYFILDEYEHLFRFSFDSPEGFMKMRALSQVTLANGLNPFSFIISGTLTWEHLCTITGSGELNTVGETLFVAPIDYENFMKMWLNIKAKLPEHLKSILTDDEKIYFETGGVPFYAKIIGETWVVSNKKPDFYKLKPFFEEVFLNLSNSEQLVLIELSKVNRKLKKSLSRSGLLQKGLINNCENYDEIKGDFFKEFLLSKFSEKHDNASVSNLENVVARINEYILNINNTNKNKKNFYIFEPTVDDAALILNLITPCSTVEQFSDFANSLYKIVFERTKNNKQLDRLPPLFKNNNKFLRIIDTIRHSLGGAHLMDTFLLTPNQLTKADILQELLGSKNEPNSPEEFNLLQIILLDKFESELKRLNIIIRN